VRSPGVRHRQARAHDAFTVSADRVHRHRGQDPVTEAERNLRWWAAPHGCRQRDIDVQGVATNRGAGDTQFGDRHVSAIFGARDDDGRTTHERRERFGVLQLTVGVDAQRATFCHRALHRRPNARRVVTWCRAITGKAQRIAEQQQRTVGLTTRAIERREESRGIAVAEPAR
jgi:hypothetical protein